MTYAVCVCFTSNYQYVPFVYYPFGFFFLHCFNMKILTVNMDTVTLIDEFNSESDVLCGLNV